jgi:hypothetical protein
MSADEVGISSGGQYLFDLLNKWRELGETSELVRSDVIAEYSNDEIYSIYVSRLTRLWLELLPFMEKRSEFSEPFLKEYNSFGECYEKIELLRPDKDDTKIVQKEKVLRAFKLEKVLRMTMDKLKITRFE